MILSGCGSIINGTTQDVGISSVPSAAEVTVGGLIGLAVDAISGGLYKLTPDQLNAELRSGSASIDTANESMMILVVMQPKADWEQVGQLAAAR